MRLLVKPVHATNHVACLQAFQVAIPGQPSQPGVGIWLGCVAQSPNLTDMRLNMQFPPSNAASRRYHPQRDLGDNGAL